MKLDERFNEKRSRLGENDLHIWQYISAHRQECAWLSIEVLGAKCNVSRTTILRFAQRLGLSGFSELRLLLRMECEEEMPRGISQNFMEQTCDSYHKMIGELRDKDCTPLFHRIHAGTETDSLLYNVTDRDLVLILSVSGESPHVLQLAKALKIRSVPTVSITQRKQNSLAQLCNLRLYVSTVEIDFGTNYQSAASFFILSELLFLKYMAYRKEADGQCILNS